MQEMSGKARRLPRRWVLVSSLAGLGLARGAWAEAGNWPNQPVRYINLFPPGGSTDVMSRLYCAAMGELAGQQFVVENRSGASGTVGQAAIAAAAPDGYTLGLGSIASLAIAPSLMPSLPYDPAKDFTYIAGIWKLPNILIANNSFPARTVPELIAELKRNPGRYAYGSSGSGTSPHLSMEMFKRQAGIQQLLHVPYRGSAPAMIDLLGGRVQLMFDNIPTALAAAREGKVRAFAVTSRERSPAAPELPTVSDFLPGYEITSWGGLVGPAGLPDAVVRRLAGWTGQVLKNPAIIRQFQDNAATTWEASGEEFARFRAAQHVMFASLIEESGARLE